MASIRRFFIYTAVFFCVLNTAAAITVDDIREMVMNERYQAAMQAAEPLLKKSNRETAAINFWYGIAALESGQTKKARAALENAAERGYTDAYPELISLDIDKYDVESAQSLLDDWNTALKKAKKSLPELYEELETRLILMSNQLSRVEAIPVIARYDVPSTTFFTAVDRLNDPAVDKGELFVNDDIPFFVNNQGREVFWTQKDDDGVSRLFTAGLLDDGTREDARELTEFVGDGNIIAPFIMEDGETLYFAAEREDGVGGYDIYMTRRDGEGGFYEPSNLGMPYNSPSNDLLYVIDEEKNLGWWATDRFAGPDSITIFVFVPSATRINLPDDTENLAELAMMSDISLSLPKNFNLPEAEKRIPHPSKIVKGDNTRKTPGSFMLSLGNGEIVTSASQLSRDAASLLTEVLRTQRMLDDNIERLESMRRSYGEGNTTLKNDILSLENEVEQQHNQLKTLKNRLIRLETNRR